MICLICMPSGFGHTYKANSSCPCYNYYKAHPSNHIANRGETIQFNAILRIVFEYIATYCHIAIFNWILVKRHFICIWDCLLGQSRIPLLKSLCTGLIAYCIRMCTLHCLKHILITIMQQLTLNSFLFVDKLSYNDHQDTKTFKIN